MSISCALVRRDENADKESIIHAIAELDSKCTKIITFIYCNHKSNQNEISILYSSFDMGCMTPIK